MTTPGPQHPCSSVPPEPVCSRCHAALCACLQELRRDVLDVIRDDADLELPDELALGGMFRTPAPVDPLLLFPPQLMLVPDDEIERWLAESDSLEIAEMLLDAEIETAPEAGERSCLWCQGPVLDDFDHDFCEPSEPMSDLEFREWAQALGSIAPDLVDAVSNSRDSRLYAAEPPGHGGHAAGDTRYGRSNQRARVDAILRRSEREPERRGCPVSRPRSGRRAAGGLARRAKPQGQGS